MFPCLVHRWGFLGISWASCYNGHMYRPCKKFGLACCCCAVFGVCSTFSRVSIYWIWTFCCCMCVDICLRCKSSAICWRVQCRAKITRPSCSLLTSSSVSATLRCYLVVRWNPQVPTVAVLHLSSCSKGGDNAMPVCVMCGCVCVCVCEQGNAVYGFRRNFLDWEIVARTKWCWAIPTTWWAPEG